MEALLSPTCRLSLVTNNRRFLILLGRSVLQPDEQVFRLTLERLPTDWESSSAYHRVHLLSSSFVSFVIDQFQKPLGHTT